MADARAQSTQGRIDGGGVMRKIVVYRDLVDHAPDLHAPFDAPKLAQRLQRLCRCHTRLLCRGDRGQRIHHIVVAEEIPCEIPDRPALLAHRE